MLPAMEASRLIHVDDTLIVVDKPEGLLSVPGRGEGVHHNLWTQLQQRHADALVVHRLDQATSGLMVFARGPAAQRDLSRAFEARQVHKCYEAVVQGLVEQDAGSIDAPLSADWPNRPRQVVDPVRGKAALTRWRVLWRGTDRTRLELQPVTGRSHQLRVHLQSIGHAILGDTLYAPDPTLSARLLLHATRLSLRHPATGEPAGWSCPPPF